jgi:hypothetical protein
MWQNKYLALAKFAKKTSTYYLFYFCILYQLGRLPPPTGTPSDALSPRTACIQQHRRGASPPAAVPHN